MNLGFVKMEALGNDYIYIDMVESRNFNIADIRHAAPMMSDRHRGIGGDGVIVVDATSSSGEISVRFFNADGSEAETCGNGLRCVAQLVFDKVYTKGKHEFEITLKKTGKKVNAFVGDKTVTIDMGSSVVGKEGIIDFKDEKIYYVPVNMGNPHAVVFAKNVEALDIDEIGNFIENHKDFPERTNVEFVDIIDRENIKLRVWERGAGETMACGSGACASAVAAMVKGFCGTHINVKMPGGTATVSKNDDSIYLTSPVNYVFKGEYLIPIQ
ncbi:MAG: diaminopimelate epimerase [bacterium]